MEPRELALEIHRRLCAIYKCPISYFHYMDPLSELISALLSHRTRNRDSGHAFKNLRARFSTWEELRDASVDDVIAQIPMVTWPEQKAPRLIQVLNEISLRRNGELSLDFLEQWPEDEAQAWLEEIEGVGPKTSAAVLIFSTLRKRALPVDSHHHRVALRVGLIAKNVAVGPSHRVLKALLPEDWTPQQLYDHHEIFMFHGQRCCFFKNPACERCVLLELCPTGSARQRVLTESGVSISQGPL